MYFTKSPGIGGRIKQRIEDFIVEEVPRKKTEGEEYTIFWLEKFNWDTHKAIHALARKLHVSIKRFGFAGTKDRRAVTKQRVSAWKIEPEQLERVKIKDMKLYGFEKSSERINLGESEGNRFKIIIRNIDLDEKELKKRLENLFSELEKGIPNYFGPQRFGQIRKITHLVGKEMLKGNFETAVKIYLTEVFEKEEEDAKEVRTFLRDNWNKDGFKKSLEIFPERLNYERSMIDYLYKYPQDFAGALRRLPKKLRKMFINAYQSYVFNKLLEEKPKSEKLPLIGYDTKPIEDISKIIKKDDISTENFLMKSMPELKTSGSERECFVKPEDLEILEILKDEFNQGKIAVKIAFKLKSGSYATVILEEIMKSQPSLSQAN
jgi:tRNA pseudouridine13 synthase